MAKQVDFYLISNQIVDARYKLASRLSNKLSRLQRSVLMVTDTEPNLERLDQVLWSFSDTSFVAHEILTSNGLEATPTPCKVFIAQVDQVVPEDLGSHFDVLVNMAGTVPVFNHHFDRIVEIVEPDEADKSAARGRFKVYKEEGFELKTHPIEL
ncbi:MAG: DNA polymerase III subunit chi [Gammaproteobacteria bacterium]|nr:DNA polymerase III subunit chi [Gammaproteobacteria bacterium]